MTAALKRAMPVFALALAAIIVLSACSAPDASESTASTGRPDGAMASSAQNASEEPSVQEKSLLVITANGTSFTASLEDNSSAEAFVDLLQEGPVTLSLHDYDGFEKVGALDTSLPSNDEQITTQPGDVILYQGNQISIYYDANTWSLTRLAHIDATRDDLLAVFGEEDVDVTFELLLDSSIKK